MTDSPSNSKFEKKIKFYFKNNNQFQNDSQKLKNTEINEDLETKQIKLHNLNEKFQVLIEFSFFQVKTNKTKQKNKI